MNERYPGHINALIKSDLAPKLFTGLKEACKKVDGSKFINYGKRERRHSRGNNKYFCIGFSNIYSENIHSIIKGLHDDNSIN